MAVILCVEDDVMLLDSIVGILEEMGHDVIGAANARAALERAERRTFDLAIVDFHLEQGPDGLRVLRELRDRHPWLQRPPFALA
jgi:CheY-like chemotaxis protein